MMLPCQYDNCGKPGQRHHIVFRSQGGLDINVNFIYLCPDHHTGTKAAVHNNREYDLKLKREMQERLFHMLPKEEYTIKEIADIIHYNKNRLEKRFKRVPVRAGKYKQEDIVRKLMGDKLY